MSGSEEGDQKTLSRRSCARVASRSWAHRAAGPAPAWRRARHRGGRNAASAHDAAYLGIAHLRERSRVQHGPQRVKLYYSSA
jgi:hypothetical protein